MEVSEYDRMHGVEDRMWWYRALHANFLAALGRADRGAGGTVLDAGCGTGGLLRRLCAAYPGRMCVGVDVEPRAAALASAKSGACVAAASVTRLPFAAQTFSVALSADVLCHEAVEEDIALSEIHRCLREGGILIVSLPAYQWLMSAHDRHVRTVRRYTRGRIRKILANAGFRVVWTTYWNTFLFPIMVLARKLVRRDAKASDVGDYPAPVETVFRGVLACESALIRRGLAFPFGGSILAVAMRDG